MWNGSLRLVDTLHIGSPSMWMVWSLQMITKRADEMFNFCLLSHESMMIDFFSRGLAQSWWQKIIERCLQILAFFSILSILSQIYPGKPRWNDSFKIHIMYPQIGAKYFLLNRWNFQNCFTGIAEGYLSLVLQSLWQVVWDLVLGA